MTSHHMSPSSTRILNSSSFMLLTPDLWMQLPLSTSHHVVPQVAHMQTKLIAPSFVPSQVSSAQSWAAPSQRLSKSGHQSHSPPLPHFCPACPASQMSHESTQPQGKSMLGFVPPAYLTWTTSPSPSVWVLHPQQTPSLYHKQLRGSGARPGLNAKHTRVIMPLSPSSKDFPRSS